MIVLNIYEDQCVIPKHSTLYLRFLKMDESYRGSGKDKAFFSKENNVMISSVGFPDLQITRNQHLEMFLPGTETFRDSRKIYSTRSSVTLYAYVQRIERAFKEFYLATGIPVIIIYNEVGDVNIDFDQLWENINDC